MLHKLKNIDNFSKNIIVVFIGIFSLSFLNLLYQLLIAHRLTPSDFAAFNSLLAIFMLISTPLVTVQTALVKYTAEFKAKNETKKIQVLLSNFFQKTSALSILVFLVFYFFSFPILDKLKISSAPSGFILAMMLALSCITPVLSAGLQGLELFGWLASVSVISGILKLIFAFIFILWGFNIAGALGAFLISILVGNIASYLPLKNFISLRIPPDTINFKEILLYFIPIAISSFCFTSLVSMDMVLVRYFFSSADSGLYALAQMVGKIFLFLPGAISIAMFPRTSGLNAKNMDTTSTLKRALLYAGSLYIIASLIYNFFPNLILKILTGKVFAEAVTLGRLFSISMSFFALLFILTAYFISIKDLRFIKYLILFAGLQFLTINLFHKNLIQVQLILCINAILLFLIHLVLAYRKNRDRPLNYL